MDSGRSPRFPYFPLEEALGALRAVNERYGTEEIGVRDAYLALGYSSLHGVAAKTLASLKGYRLMEKCRRGTLRVAALGRSILEAEQGEHRLALCREAALMPAVFRRIWQKARRFTREELLESLAVRKFTRSGAYRASEVYSENNAFARLSELDEAAGAMSGSGRFSVRAAGKMEREEVVVEEEEDDSEDDGIVLEVPVGALGKSTERGGLALPLSCGVVVIPGGMTEADFELLTETIRLWRGRLVDNS